MSRKRKLKTISLTLSYLLFLIQASNAQSCLPNGITFNTQAQIDAFPTTYPECTEIGGDVFIKGNNIVNLASLNSISKITGNLRINDNPNLINLIGLNNLREVGGLFSLFNNGALVSLNGLEDLQGVGGSFSLSGNNSLNSLTSLVNLKKVGGFTIFGCYKLTNLDGLQNLIELQNMLLNDTYLSSLQGLNNLKKVKTIELYGNTKLKFINAFNTIDTISEYIKIINNIELENLNGFNNLKNVGDFISIINNSKLLNFSGLENLTSVKDLLVGFNSKLKNFEGLGNLTFVSGLFLINNNRSLLNLAGLNKLKSVNGEIRIIENDSIVNLLGCNTLENANVIAITNNPRLLSCEGMPNLVKVYTALNIGENAKLQNCNGFNSLKSIDAGYMNIYENPNLNNLDGFPNLEYMGGKLQVSKNAKLLSISGFNKLNEVGFATNEAQNQVIYINENPKLLTINGFQSLNKCQSLTITDNVTLNEINGFYKLTWVSELDITNNPTLKEIKTFTNLSNSVKKIWLSNSSLESITGLRNIKADSMTYLYIRGNTNLATCNLKFICDYVDNNSQPNYYISWNKKGCNFGNDFPFTQTSEYSTKNDLKCTPYICSASNLVVNYTNQLCLFDSIIFEADVAGNLPVNYTWQNGSTSNTIELIIDTINNVSLITEDGDGCRIYYDTNFYGIHIEKPAIITIEESCFNCNNAEINISVSDLSLKILWADHDTLFNRKNLKPGNYQFTLFNVNGCTYDTTINILPYACLDIKYNIDISNSKCFDSLGQIVLTFDTPNMVNEIIWSNGHKGNIIKSKDELPSVQIYLNDNCVYHDTFQLVHPSKIDYAFKILDERCFGKCDGRLTIDNINGGTPPYKSYSNNTLFIDSIVALCAGDIHITLIDNNNCIIDTSIIIHDGMQTPITFDGDSLFCYGESTVLSINEEYETYYWNTGETTKSIEIITAENVQVIVNNNGCIDSSYFNVFENPELISHFEFKKDTLNIFIDGGTPPYSIEWSTAEFTNSIVPLNGGIYYVTIVDFNGCTKQDSIEVTTTNNKDITDFEFKIFPNPSQDILYINSETEEIYRLSDVMGKLIQSFHVNEGKNEIDMHTLQDGMYLLRNERGDVYRVVKE